MDAPSRNPCRSQARKGRGVGINPEGRFAREARADVDDGWDSLEVPLPRLDTTVQAEAARSIVARNDSPDIPFEQSINPYRGCGHACPYCYARPSHAYMDLSPGLDFETKLFYKRNAAELLEQALRKPGYRVSAIAMGTNTDPYQPVEREYRVTRSILEVLRDYRHPVTIVTKSALLIRDLDILQDLARDDLVRVMVSVTSLDAELKRKLEPLTAGPKARLRTIRALTEAGVPAGAMVAPVIPAINDAELEHIVEAVADAGALSAAYVILRLPYEVKDIFRDWLGTHYPDRAAHVMNLVRAMRGGCDNDSRFGHRMRGEGEYAKLIAQRFRAACRRHGLPKAGQRPLRTDLFAPPTCAGDQIGLFN